MSELVRAVTELLGANQFVSGGVALMLMGTAATTAYRTIPVTARAIVRRCTTRVEVRDREAFDWLAEWLAQARPATGWRRSSVSVSYDPTSTPEKRAPVLHFSPGRGKHLLRHRNHWVLIARVAESEPDGDSRPVMREHFVLRAFGTGAGFLEELLREAAAVVERERRGKVGIYLMNPSRFRSWIAADYRTGRDPASVILSEGVAERIMDDVGEFLESAHWYCDMGIPHRRGYLFHGPPGCGKTTMAQAIGARFRMDIFMVNLGGKIDDTQLATSLLTVRPGSIILLEDVDAVFHERVATDQASSFVTFSGLLNALDGVASFQGSVVVMTTNHPDRLDPALIRPGRVDVIQYFPLATPDLVARLFLRFFPGEGAAARRISEVVPDGAFSMAKLQNIFLTHRHSAREAESAIEVAAAENAKRLDLAS